MSEKLHVDTAALGMAGFKIGLLGYKESGPLSTGFADAAADVAGLQVQAALMQAQGRRDGASSRLSGEVGGFANALVSAAVAVENSDDTAARSIADVRAK